MKSRRILAAVLAPVVALSATAAVVSAEDASDEATAPREEVIFSGPDEVLDWNDGPTKNAYTCQNDLIKDLKVGDSIVLTLSNTDTNPMIAIKDSSTWAALEGNKNHPGYQSWGGITLDPGTTTLTHVVVEEDLAALSTGSFIVDGANVTLVSIKLVISGSSDEPTPSEEVIFSGPAEVLDWNDGPTKNAYTCQNNLIKDLKVGDSIVLTLSNTDTNPMIAIKDSSTWTPLPGNASDPGYQSWGGIILTAGVTTHTHVVVEDDLAYLSTGAFIVDGANVTLESIKLVILPSGNNPGGPGEGGGTESGGTESGGESGAVTVPVMPSPDNTDNTPSGGDSSDQTSGDETNKPAKPEGDITADITGVDTQKGVEGAALNEKLLVKDGKKYTWNDVESVTFVSDKLFSVAFSTNEELAGTTWFTMGLDKVPTARADEGSQWATSWTIGADELALFDTTQDDNGYVKVIAKEDGTDINVAVTLRADADAPADSGNSSDDNNTSTPDSTDGSSNPGNNGNPSTGIAIAAAPLALAGVAAVVATRKKRK